MIVSASRRTDMNNAQISRLPLNPELVDCLVFWTKDAENILSHYPQNIRVFKSIYGYIRKTILRMIVFSA